ncbi:N-acetyl sugar amidotransferase [Curvivirga sp.]|uniref:N-acetyl sugar amidotransferase n=1 Tax=Curvivirga sp. TaxID=2856848 RepID=UPI003B5BAC0E
MKYCVECILPDTRPGIELDDNGVCTACHGHRDKENKIDWDDRAQSFEGLVADAKSRSNGYDCIVPVSGGKDSWYQIIKAQSYGLNVLAVTWRTPARTEIGQENVDRMIQKLGVDHIDYTINPDVERRFMKAAYEKLGATGLPMHMALFSIPIRLAVQLQIPLIVWGENSQLEYGGNEWERLSTNLDANWLAKHGCLQSTQAFDWIGLEGLTEKDLSAYAFPQNPNFEVRSVFLGSFFKWNSFENTEIAKKYGFKYAKEDLKTGTWDFADIDCKFISLHHFLKWYKFGITRAFDNLSVQIRYGMTTRNEAIKTVTKMGLQRPDGDIEAFCEFQKLPVSWFMEVAESFRNKDIWKQEGGRWILPDFLVQEWDWDQ